MAAVSAATFPPMDLPSTDTTTSPGRTPPTAAGLACPPTGLSPWICTWLELGTPTKVSSTHSSTKAMQEVHGRAGHRHQQPGVERLVPVEAASSAGSTSSRLVIPGIFT